jgi:hypothetical protein
VLLFCPLPVAAQPIPPTRLIELLKQQYGIVQPPECPELDTSVGTTAVQFYANDPATFFVVIFNNGAANCYRSQSPGVTTTTGQLIPANGGFLEFDFKTDGLIPAQADYIVCSGAGNNIHGQRCDLR